MCFGIIDCCCEDFVDFRNLNMETVNFTDASNGTDISVGQEQNGKIDENNIAIQAASLLAYKIGISIFTATVLIITSKKLFC